MKTLLVIFAALFATEASAQFNFGPAKSRRVPVATQNALHEAMIHMRFEAACRDHLQPSQRAELRGAAGTAFVKIGYNQSGVEAALGELDEMMAKQSRWAAGKCVAEYESFREGRRDLDAGELR